MRTIPQRLLSILQLTRMALVFTALADGFTALLFYWTACHQAPWYDIDPRQILAVAMISVGLYGFGMSFNDIIDRRRDAKLAADRPLPSGRIGIVPAHIISVLLLLVALGGGFWLMQLRPAGWISLLLTIFTALLIIFYDLTGKYLVWPGILALGLVRFFHATITAPTLGWSLWQPLLLLNHVTLLSAIAYAWEDKRPRLTQRHWVHIVGGLVSVDAAIVALVWILRGSPLQHTSAYLFTTLGIGAALGAIGFLFVAMFIHWWFDHDRRLAGKNLMLYGLLWIIVYDAILATLIGGYTVGGLILLLLPIAWLSVHLMRIWSRALSLAQKPTFKRA